jgi:hypothetical protein
LALSGLQQAITTVAPLADINLVAAKPVPLLAPVIITILSVKSGRSFSVYNPHPIASFRSDQPENIRFHEQTTHWCVESNITLIHCADI